MASIRSMPPSTRAATYRPLRDNEIHRPPGPTPRRSHPPPRAATARWRAGSGVAAHDRICLAGRRALVYGRLVGEDGGTDRDRSDARRATAGDPETAPAAAAGKHSRVASRYPALAQALGDRGGGGGEPTIHDAATAAVEHKGGGAGVDPGVAARVGAHLGADFSDVRVHGDPLSREATAAMGARAFAYGGDVFLGPGESGGDLGLMAHELTHVAQQGAAGQRLPQRAVQVGDANSPAEHEADQVASAVTGGARPAALLVDQAPVGPGQMLKSQFMEQLQAQVTAAADAELGPIYSAIGCPYIEQYFGRYAGQPAAAGEALLRRFAPGARAAGSAADLIPAVVARVREGVRQWRDTGEPPADLAAMAPQGGGGAGAAPAQAQALRAPDGGETLASLEAELGPGQPLDGATASRMSDALGIDVSSARIHTGPVAARKAADAGALAFAVGANVVMGAGAPGAGTLEGDALLAHELAHTAQQADAAVRSGGAPTPDRRRVRRRRGPRRRGRGRCRRAAPRRRARRARPAPRLHVQDRGPAPALRRRAAQLRPGQPAGHRRALRLDLDLRRQPGRRRGPHRHQGQAGPRRRRDPDPGHRRQDPRALRVPGAVRQQVHPHRHRRQPAVRAAHRRRVRRHRPALPGPAPRRARRKRQPHQLVHRQLRRDPGPRAGPPARPPRRVHRRHRARPRDRDLAGRPHRSLDHGQLPRRGPRRRRGSSSATATRSAARSAAPPGTRSRWRGGPSAAPCRGRGVRPLRAGRPCPAAATRLGRATTRRPRPWKTRCAPSTAPRTRW